MLSSKFALAALKSRAALSRPLPAFVIIQKRNFSRLRDFYNNTLRDDISILQYQYTSPKLEEYQQQLEKAQNESPTATPQKKKKLTETEALLRKNEKPIPAIVTANPFNSPSIKSITVHIRMKEALVSKSNILSGLMALQCITGQRAEVINASKDAAAWKLRKGNPIAAKVKLTGDPMYEFLDKLVELVLPRLKEWDGLRAAAGDGLGNFSLGFSPAALGLFPEIENIYDMFPIIYGFTVNIKTSANRNEDGRLLMSGFKLPFVKPTPKAPPKKSKRRK